MISKGLLIILLVSLALSYEKDGNTLVLKDEDFPQVINEHEYILIKFYALWCDHCQTLAPTFTQIADEFAAKESQITFARIECSENKNVSQMLEIQGYPKLILFHNGERIDYEGQRNKLNIMNWLDKIMTDPLEPIDEQTYKKLEDREEESIVFHGSPQSAQAKILRKVAYSDYINKYYIANLGKQQNTIEMFRPIDPTLSHDQIDENIELWIRTNQRPLVRKFDDSVISLMFGQNKTGVVLFNDQEAEWLNEAFKQSAKQYLKSGKEMVFANVEKNGQHYTKFGEQFLKIHPSKIAIALVDRKDGSKFVLVKDPQSLTVFDIVKFLQNWQQKKLRRYELPDEIKEIKEMKGETEQQNREAAQQNKPNDEL